MNRKLALLAAGAGLVLVAVLFLVPVLTSGGDSATGSGESRPEARDTRTATPAGSEPRSSASAAPKERADPVPDEAAAPEVASPTTPAATETETERKAARDAEPSPQPRKGAAKKRGTLAEALRTKVSLDLNGGTLADAVDEIASLCGAEILLDPDVADVPLTMQLKDVEARAALRTLALVAGGLEVAEEGEHVVLRRRD